MWSLMPWKKSDSSQNGTLTAEPFEREFLRIRNDFDRLVQSMWKGSELPEMSHLWLTDHFEENDTHYLLAVGAPGFEASDFDVQCEGDRLLVKAERKASDESKSLRRCRYGSLHRTFPLPEDAQREGIEAEYRNGVLELRFPKDPEKKDVKRISVKSA